MKRNLWTTWPEFLNVSSNFQEIPKQKLLPEKCSDVMKLPAEDMGLYGFYPASDGFCLVICKICGNAVKPQSLKFHMEYKHKRVFISKKPEPKSQLHAKNGNFFLTYGNQCKNIDTKVSQIRNISSHSSHRFCPTVSKSSHENTVALQSEKLKVEHKPGTINESANRILTQNASVRSRYMPEIRTNSMHPSVSYERLSCPGVQRIASSYSIRKPAVCSVSESVSNLTSTNKQLQIPRIQYHPRPSAICTYGMRTTEHGLVLCSHRSDSIREALKRSIEEEKRFLARLSQGNVSINKSCSSDSSLSETSPTSFKKNSPFITPGIKFCDIKDQSTSSVSCMNVKALSGQECLSKVTLLNKTTPTEKNRQSVECGDKMYHPQKTLIDWSKVDCSAGIDLNNLPWRANAPHFYPF